jgi:hypothetical protein
MTVTGGIEMFQPEDPPEPNYDAMADSMFDAYEKLGYAVISRDEWHAKLDDAAKDGYAEGRNDEREENLRLLSFAYSKLQHAHFSKQEDALAMDEIKLMLLGGAA